VIELAPLAAGERAAAARMYADAFVDDPGWRAVGPNRRRALWHCIRRIYGAELAYAERCGGFVLATRDEGLPSAAIVVYPPRRWPLPWWTIGYGAAGGLLAGPASLARMLRGQATLDRGHPDEPHLFVSLLAVDPAHQRGGRGRVLLNEALRRADEAGVPAYLDTANPANLPYYRSFGFELIGEERLPRDAPLWLLLRPPPR
jgi:GNAT superfamily N-acetyltransferase